jgi:hypothetical protein
VTVALAELGDLAVGRQSRIESGLRYCGGKPGPDQDAPDHLNAERLLGDDFACPEHPPSVWEPDLATGVGEQVHQPVCGLAKSGEAENRSLVLCEVEWHRAAQSRLTPGGDENHYVAATRAGHEPAKSEPPHQQHELVEVAKAAAELGDLGFGDVHNV